MATETTLVKRPAVQIIKESVSDFGKRLPASIDATKWTMQLATAVQKNPDLLACDPGSLLLASFEAAELGISLSPSLQLAYLVPYNKTVQFQLGYRGMIQKAYETGDVKTIFAEIVYANDKFERQFAPVKNLFHAPPVTGERGERLGAYALIQFVDGTVDWEYLTAEQIERRKKHSKNGNGMLWTTFWEEGWRKTPIRALFKRIPLRSRALENFAEAVNRDAETDMEPEPEGRLELEDVSYVPGLKPREIAPAVREPEGNAEVFFEVGKETTTVSGRTIMLKDALPKLGAKWDSEARVWRMPAERTAELVAACEEKRIRATEVGADKSREPGLF